MREQFTALECLEAFLRLPAEIQTVARAGQFLSRSEDVFLALSLLRRDRNSNPAEVLRMAIFIYGICGAEGGPPAHETEFFLGEAALIAGNAARGLGARSEGSKWLSVSAAHFRTCPASGPLIAKARLAFATLARDCHDYERARTEAIDLAVNFEMWKMTRELTLCRLIECLVQKETGAVNEACIGFERLLEDLRRGCEPEILASALLPYSELILKRGDASTALELLAEAAVVSSGYPLIESCVFIIMAECHLELGNDVEALKWSGFGIAKASGGGGVGLVAYLRVWRAELLIRCDLVEEARQELMLAVPMLKRERMIPEALHAASLLSEVNSRTLFAPGLTKQDPL